MTPTYLLCCALFFQMCGAFVVLEQNGFKGLHVFVSPSVPFNDWNDVKDGLIDAFQKTSETMYYGSGGRSYFREYTVIVPPEWEHQHGWNGYIQQNDLESEMTIHSLSDSVSLYDGFPYVDHSRKCNANGDMMHFPSTYFKGDNKAGDVDKLMLKTWMSYRYGMFDELGYPQDSKHPAVYCEANGTRTATQCSNVPLAVGEPGKTFVSIRGQQYDDDCNCAQEGNLLNCLYLPLVNEAQPEELYSSVMGFHHIYRIQTFCDTDSGFYFHDKESRNLQNTLCGKPTLDTMLEHYDFQHGNNDPDYVEDLVPKVSIYQHRTNIVFVLDTKAKIGQRIGSMVKSVLSEWMQDHALYMNVGIVAVGGGYHGGPNQHFEIISEVTHLTQQSMIDTMLDQIQRIKYTSRGSWNQIDEGLRQSIQMVDVMDGIIVLISDGSENKGDMLNCCQSVIKEKNIHIVAIDIGKEDRTNKMEELTQQCNQGQGMYFYAAQNPLLVHNALDTATRTFSYPQQSKRVKIHSSMKIAGEVWIDGDLDSVEVTFHVLTPIDITKDTIMLLHNGTQVKIEIDPAKLPKIIKTIDIGQNPAMCGQWQYFVSSEQGSVGVYITGVSKHMNNVNNVDCQVLKTMVNGNPHERRILAKPVKNNKPLINARVTYTLNDGDQNDLFDDGEKGMDAIKNDGVYTAILKDNIAEGTTIQCIVNGKEDTFAHPGFQKWYDAFGETVQRPLCCGNEAPLPDNKNITGKFTRIALSNYYKA